MYTRPFETAGMTAYPTRAAWDSQAVQILGGVLARWDLTAGTSYSGGYSGAVLKVTTAEGSPAVLKVGFPHPEGVAEALGLEALGAGLAPAVLRQDPWSWAMLLEELQPGTVLSLVGMSPADALRCGGEVLARISATGPVPGIPRLADVVAGYVTVARSRYSRQRSMLERLGVHDLVVEAIDELERLSAAGFDTAFVHGDFNPGNILQTSDGWSIVDPKPMTGDPCYDLWPLVGQLGAPFSSRDPAAALASQLTIASTSAGLDPVRSARWAFGRSGLNVSWYLEEQNLALATQDAAELRVWAALRASLVQ